MSLDSWLKGNSPKPGYKRKQNENDDSASSMDSPAKKRFTKSLNQSSFDWYVQDENKLWHCRVCRNANIKNAYAKGHETVAKTTNHLRHAACKYMLI